MTVYKIYFEAYGVKILAAGLLGALIYTLADVSKSLWLSWWANDAPPGYLPNSTQIDTSLRDLRLDVYGGIGILLGTYMPNKYR